MGDLALSQAIKVLAVASGGGHWVQLSRLRPAWDGCRVTYATTDAELAADVLADAAERGQPAPEFHLVLEANRWQKWRLLRSVLQIAWICLKFRPDVIVTTGAAPGFLAIRLGGLLGARTVWIDSIANAEELSLSGRKAGGHVDLWLTQWEDLSSADGPKYLGSVI